MEITKFLSVTTLLLAGCAAREEPAYAASVPPPNRGERELIGNPSGVLSDFQGKWTYSVANEKSISLTLEMRGEVLSGDVCCVSDSGSFIDCSPEEDNIDSAKLSSTGVLEIVYYSSYDGSAVRVNLSKEDKNHLGWAQISDGNAKQICPASAVLVAE